MQGCRLVLSCFTSKKDKYDNAQRQRGYETHALGMEQKYKKCTENKCFFLKDVCMLMYASIWEQTHFLRTVKRFT